MGYFEALLEGVDLLVREGEGLDDWFPGARVMMIPKFLVLWTDGGVVGFVWVLGRA